MRSPCSCVGAHGLHPPACQPAPPTNASCFSAPNPCLPAPPARPLTQAGGREQERGPHLQRRRLRAPAQRQRQGAVRLHRLRAEEARRALRHLLGPHPLDAGGLTVCAGLGAGVCMLGCRGRMWGWCCGAVGECAVAVGERDRPRTEQAGLLGHAWRAATTACRAALLGRCSPKTLCLPASPPPVPPPTAAPRAPEPV